MLVSHDTFSLTIFLLFMLLTLLFNRCLVLDPEDNQCYAHFDVNKNYIHTTLWRPTRISVTVCGCSVGICHKSLPFMTTLAMVVGCMCVKEVFKNVVM